MINIYKHYEDNESSKLQKIENIEHGCWINIVAPTQDELNSICEKTGVPLEFLRAPLDDEESSRLEVEGNISLIVIDMPFTGMEDDSLTYDTYPLAIIHTEDIIITICLKNSKIINDFIASKVKTFFTFKRSRFILQMLFRISTYYLIYLRQIEKKSTTIEKKLHSSLKNRELIQLLSLQKSLVYFSASLKSNEITLEKMMKLKFIQKYEEDQDVLEDVIIENKQAIEMANIYSSVLSGTMDAFASVISNNLNIVMKLLASVTIVMTIPNIISGVFGMNVPNPLQTSPEGFWIIVAFIIVACTIITTLLNKKDMF